MLFRSVSQSRYKHHLAYFRFCLFLDCFLRSILCSILRPRCSFLVRCRLLSLAVFAPILATLFLLLSLRHLPLPQPLPLIFLFYFFIFHSFCIPFYLFFSRFCRFRRNVFSVSGKQDLRPKMDQRPSKVDQAGI